jgi:transposase
LLSAKGFTIDEIARIYQIHRDTVVATFDRWEKDGIQGLYDAPKSGRPPKLSDDETDKAIKLLKKDIVIKANLRWKRMRKSTKGKRDKVEFKRAKAEIAALHAQEAAGELDVYYFDGAGFNLTPAVPYAWQEVGETIEILSSSSKRINVLGFCNKAQDFHATTVQGSVSSATVIACFDQFCRTISKKTAVIIDNAPVHTSGKFKEKLKAWEKKGLFVKYLPTYSPELNLIEIVWRFIKYNWLPLSAYLSFKHLKRELLKVLDLIGSKYRITFA